MGVPVDNKEIVENSNLHNKKPIIERIQAQEQAQAQAAGVQSQLMVQKMQSEAKADDALAAERINKIGLDAALNAERLARAEQDRTGGELNLVKAVKELEGIDLQSLREKLALLNELESRQRMKEEATQSQLSQQSQQSQQEIASVQQPNQPNAAPFEQQPPTSAPVV